LVELGAGRQHRRAFENLGLDRFVWPSQINTVEHVRPSRNGRRIGRIEFQKSTLDRAKDEVRPGTRYSQTAFEEGAARPMLRQIARQRSYIRNTLPRREDIRQMISDAGDRTVEIAHRLRHGSKQLPALDRGDAVVASDLHGQTGLGDQAKESGRGVVW